MFVRLHIPLTYLWTLILSENVNKRRRRRREWRGRESATKTTKRRSRWRWRCWTNFKYEDRETRCTSTCWCLGIHGWTIRPTCRYLFYIVVVIYTIHRYYIVNSSIFRLFCCSILFGYIYTIESHTWTLWGDIIGPTVQIFEVYWLFF